MRPVLRYLLLSLMLPMTLAAGAQTAAATLDRAIRLLEAEEGLQVTFRMTLEEETVEGRYYAMGRQFYYDSEPVRAWYDGTDLWVWLEQSGEVNLSTPHKEDLAEINPLLSLSEVTRSRFLIREKREGSSVRVVATPRKDYAGPHKRLSALLTPEGWPLSLSIEEKGLKEPIAVEVTEFRTGPFREAKEKAFFEFTPDKVPGATLIDLR